MSENQLDPVEAVLRVLADAGAPLHRTVILDHALKAGYIDPFVISDVRKAIFAAIREAVRQGSVVETEKGVYSLARRD